MTVWTSCGRGLPSWELGLGTADAAMVYTANSRREPRTELGLGPRVLRIASQYGAYQSDSDDDSAFDSDG